MILIACLDDKGGMMFNRRRQSQDRVLRQRILEKTAGARLWMNDYSEKQFAGEHGEQIETAADFLDRAGDGEFCFIENIDGSAYEEKIEKIILYKWNRTYPADVYFGIPLIEHGWHLTESEEFAGHSHEKITEEVYEK